MQKHWCRRAGLLLVAALAVTGGGCRNTGPVSPAAESGTRSSLVRSHQQRHELQDWIAWRNVKMSTSRPVPVPNGLRFSVPSHHRGEPVPIPGGFLPGFHVWVPGPVALGFQGEDIEPNVITNFAGFSAMAYLLGPAAGSDGKSYDMFNDMRLYSGIYVADNGSINRGTFAFV